MTAFSAALAALNLTHADAADLLEIGIGSVKDIATGRRGARLKPDGWSRLGGLFEMIEQAADEIIADQAELDHGMGVLALRVSDIPLDRLGWRELAAARAMFVLGPDLLEIVED